MNLALPEIRHNLDGINSLVDLYAQAKVCGRTHIKIDMRRVSWFDADMCAAFGAILYRLSRKLNTIELTSIPCDVEKILSKNGFLSHYGHELTPDDWGTTIPYQRFDTKDDRYFAEYVTTKLTRRPEIPPMSPRLIKKFTESIFEVFSNAVLHSKTRMGIFSCGQFFPKRNRLDFSVADLGIGIRRNILEKIGLDLAPEAAITWATADRNTTKQGSIPGGLGLKLLQEFVDLNGGRIQIVSDAGYWRREDGSTTIQRLVHPFPGTLVNLEINTADKQSYVLSSELSDTDIF